MLQNLLLVSYCFVVWVVSGVFRSVIWLLHPSAASRKYQNVSFGVVFASSTERKVLAHIRYLFRGFNKHRRPTKCVGYFAQRSRLLIGSWK